MRTIQPIGRGVRDHVVIPPLGNPICESREEASRKEMDVRRSLRVRCLEIAWGGAAQQYLIRRRDMGGKEGRKVPLKEGSWK